MKIEHSARTEARRFSTTGFSLLELLIVLAVIAGLMAIAWPNLRKPLGDTPLSQAAASLRELFDECRYQAVLRAELTMLRLEKQSSTIVMGSWETLLANQLDLPTPTTETASDSADTNSNVLLKKPRPPFQYRFALPPDIVIEEVVWSMSLPTETGNADSADTLLPGNSGSSNRDLADSAAEAPQVSSFDSSNSGYWYIPFTPAGISKDVSIILRDTTTQKRLALQYQQGTGLITLTKLADANSSIEASSFLPAE